MHSIIVFSWLHPTGLLQSLPFSSHHYCQHFSRHLPPFNLHCPSPFHLLPLISPSFSLLFLSSCLLHTFLFTILSLSLSPFLLPLFSFLILYYFLLPSPFSSSRSSLLSLSLHISLFYPSVFFLSHLLRISQDIYSEELSVTGGWRISSGNVSSLGLHTLMIMK